MNGTSPSVLCATFPAPSPDEFSPHSQLVWNGVCLLCPRFPGDGANPVLQDGVRIRLGHPLDVDLGEILMDAPARFARNVHGQFRALTRRENRVAFMRKRVCTVCKRRLPAKRFWPIQQHYPLLRDSQCRDCSIVLRRTSYANGKYHYPDRRTKRPKWKPSLKMTARSLVQQAIRKGTLVRQSCKDCGKRNTHAHHDDYRKPLAVQWLCPAHHMMRHRKPVDTPIAP